jgi:hypothetical protein
MSEQITINVSNQVLHHASQVAEQTNRRVEDVLAEWLERVINEIPVEMLSDEEVLALTELRLTPEQQISLDALLIQNREGMIDSDGRRRLDELMHTYEQGLLRKAQALRVAVQRGLREPLQP